MRYPSYAALIGVGVAVLALSACGAKKAPPAQPAPMVSVATPLQEKVVDWDDFTGRFEAVQKVEVRARVGGYLQGVHFRDGQFVQKGQLLFTLDPRPAQALLASAKAQAEQARGEAARAETLLASQAISREEYEAKRAAALSADATVRARALDLEFTRVTAPVAGVVSYRRVDPGNVIAGGSSAAEVLTTVVSTNPIHFVFDASEGQLLKYQREGASRGTRVNIRLQDETRDSWTGTIDFADNALDDGTGAVRMRAVVANPTGFLKPGLFGRAQVEGSGAYPAMLIPEGAVSADGAHKVAYVVGKDGVVAQKVLQLGPSSGGLRVVRSGLRPDDRVIVNGVQRARPGEKVQAKTVPIVRAAAPPPGQATTATPPSAAATPAG